MSNPEKSNNIMDQLKRIAFTLLLALAVFPLSAQQDKVVDSEAYLFRFIADKDMFFSPWSGNGKELERLLAAIEKNRAAIESGWMYLYVASHCTSGRTEQSDSVEKTRRNRVKSELITRGKVKEVHFVTDKKCPESYKTGDGEPRNVVIVLLPAGVEEVAELAGADAATRVEAYDREVSGEAERERLASEKKREEERLAGERAEAERLAKERAAREKEETERLAAERQARPRAGVEAPRAVPHTFALCANLLRWATLTPDLGVEWRMNKRWSLLLNGTWTSWSWNDKDRRHALWEVVPELRYYIGKEKHGYLGTMFRTGQFNYKFSATGKQGDLMGGGLTGGYQLHLNRALSLDFSMEVGCTHAGFDKYRVIDGVRVRDGKGSKDYWGVNRLGVSLVWNLF